MSKDLQQLRKDAGFKSSRDFADECDFTYSTYARYEGEPAIIPTKSAWKIADVLGCTIDDVVGRETPTSAGAKMQKRYDALDAEGRALVDQFMKFAESEYVDRQEFMRKEHEEERKRRFTYYLLDLFSQRAKEGDPVKPNEEKTEEFRATFEKHVMRALADTRMPIEEVVEEYEGIMWAYGAWVDGTFYDSDDAG